MFYTMTEFSCRIFISLRGIPGFRRTLLESTAIDETNTTGRTTQEDPVCFLKMLINIG
jgi:hypothetical protein